jgi:D-alanyl-D-alanine carboxypeptidase
VNATGKQKRACFGDMVAGLLSQLGIPADYGERHQLKLQEECRDLVTIGADIFAREQKMTPAAARAWLLMKESASDEDIELQVVSAFRPVDYQAAIIRKKLDAGQCIEEVLKVSAAPGYSEHHSGRALDITCPGFVPLEEAFETSPAFNWLMANAQRFGFVMSYPRNNPHGVAYEPWHWCWIK